MRNVINIILKFLKRIIRTYEKAFAHKAFNELLKQVERGNPNSYYAVASMYEVGTAYAAKDLVSAYCWYHESLKRGVTEAQEKIRSLELKMSPEQLSSAKNYLTERTANT